MNRRCYRLVLVAGSEVTAPMSARMVGGLVMALVASVMVLFVEDSEVAVPIALLIVGIALGVGAATAGGEERLKGSLSPGVDWPSAINCSSGIWSTSAYSCKY